MDREWSCCCCCCCCVENDIPTEGCNVDVINGLRWMLRDGVRAVHSNLKTTTANKMKWESRAEIIYSYWLEKEIRQRIRATAALFLSVVCVNRSHCQEGRKDT